MARTGGDGRPLPRLSVAAPHDVFEETMERVDGLLLLHRALGAGAGRSRRRSSDVLRGALVLGVGALDALVLDSVVAAIPRAERDGNLPRSVAKWVKEDSESFLALLGDRQPGWRVAELCRRRLGQPTFERAETIESVIRDVAERDPPWPRAAEILSSDGRVWDAAAVKRKLDEIVERQHGIAHRGDLLPGTTRTRAIRGSYVEEAVRVIRAVGSAVAEALA